MVTRYYDVVPWEYVNTRLDPQGNPAHDYVQPTAISNPSSINYQQKRRRKRGESIYVFSSCSLRIVCFASCSCLNSSSERLMTSLNL